MKKNKQLRSFLENRKVKQGINSNVLSKPYQAPKTIKRVARQDANIYQKMRDSPERLAAIKAKEPQIPKEVPKPLHLTNKAPKEVAPKLNTSVSLKKPSFLTRLGRKKGLIGAAVGAGALGYAISNRIKDRNKQR